MSARAFCTCACCHATARGPSCRSHSHESARVGLLCSRGTSTPLVLGIAGRYVVPVEHSEVDPGQGGSARDELLAKVMAVFRRTGLDTDVSLRTLAREVDSSHRMLSYHFG